MQSAVDVKTFLSVFCTTAGLVETTEQVYQTSEAKDHEHVWQVSSHSPCTSLSTPSTSKVTEQRKSLSSVENALCLDTMEISEPFVDHDSDVELPTFDLVSSLGF